MDQKCANRGLPSVGWVITLLIGLAFTAEWIGMFLQSLAAEPVQWSEAGESLANGAVIGIPFGLVAWFLWARRGKKMPSLAFVVTAVTGSFFLLFSLAECIGGFASQPIEWSAAVGGLMQIAAFALPFLAVAWLLWFRPKIGAVVLICLGVAFAVMFKIEIQDLMDQTMAALVGLPIILGAFTLVRELMPKKGQTMHMNAD